jgi:hypothetical protein
VASVAKAGKTRVVRSKARARIAARPPTQPAVAAASPPPAPNSRPQPATAAERTGPVASAPRVSAPAPAKSPSVVTNLVNRLLGRTQPVTATLR